VTLGRIFSCFHDRDHVHPHIHANSYIGSYAKHVIHPPKKVLQVPKRFLLFQKEKGVIEKKERKRKNKCSKSIEKRYIYICEA
jgi:hypothetical protein